MPSFLTVADIIARLGLSKPDSILRAIAAGELKACNVGAGKLRPTWRISEQALQEWLDRRSATPMPKAERRTRKQIQKPEVEYV